MDLGHMTSFPLLSAVGVVVRGALGAIRTAAAAPQSRGFSGETDPAKKRAAGGGQLFVWSVDRHGDMTETNLEPLKCFHSFKADMRR